MRYQDDQDENPGPGDSGGPGFQMPTWGWLALAGVAGWYFWNQHKKNQTQTIPAGGAPGSPQGGIPGMPAPEGSNIGPGPAQAANFDASGVVGGGAVITDPYAPPGMQGMPEQSQGGPGPSPNDRIPGYSPSPKPSYRYGTTAKDVGMQSYMGMYETLSGDLID